MDMSTGRSWFALAFVLVALGVACRSPLDAPTDGRSIGGLVDIPAPTATVQWLKSQIVPLATTDPTAPVDDLRPLLAMIGSAHIVGLGEGTHGTREFFLMKHRILELLVREAGFRYFAIEGVSTTADDINDYVLTGRGDPRALLTTLDAWAWNAQEVLDLIEWMRAWNLHAPVSDRVQFFGFDMRQASWAINRIIEFIDRHDPQQFTFVDQHIRCLGPYIDGVDMPSGSTYYRLAADARAACARDIAAVHAMIRDRRAQYTAATSPVEFERLLHNARIVQQWEAAASKAAVFDSAFVERDRAMAENIGWIRDQGGPDAKVVVWAHNGHINTIEYRMGRFIRDRFGTDYVTLGFLFGTGTFNAQVNGVRPQAIGAPAFPAGSLESVFHGTGVSIALFDTHRIRAAGAVAAPLAGPIAMRHIGLVYGNVNGRWFPTRYFPDEFDMLIYLSTTTASRLLPSR